MKICPSTYSIYGYTARPCNVSFGYNGAWLDCSTGCYILGQGYRFYSPSIQRFYSADALSPFIADTMNAYFYCNGDPVNYRDSTGHMRFPSWFPGARHLNHQPKTRNRISELASMPHIIEKIASHLPTKDLRNLKKAYPEHKELINHHSLKKSLELVKEERLGNTKTLNTLGVLTKDSIKLKKLNEHYFTNKNMHKDNSNWTKRFQSIKEERRTYEASLEERLDQVRQ